MPDLPGQDLIDLANQQQADSLSALAATPEAQASAQHAVDLSQRLGIDAGFIVQDPQHYQAMADSMPVEVDWQGMVNRSPKLAQLYSDSVNMSLLREDASKFLTTWDRLQDFKAREQIGTFNLLGQSFAQGLMGSLQKVISVPAAAEAGIRAAIGADVSKGIGAQLVYGLEDAIKASQRDVSSFRLGAVQEFIGAPIGQMLGSPETYALPGLGAAKGGAMAAKTAGGLLKEGLSSYRHLVPSMRGLVGASLQDLEKAAVSRAIGTQGALLKGTFNAMGALKGAALVSSEISGSMALQERLKQKQAESVGDGAFLLPDLKDISEAALNGLVTYGTTLLGGLTAELRFATGGKGAAGSNILMDFMRDPASEGLEEGLQSALDDIYSGRGISGSRFIESALKGAGGSLAFAAGNLKQSYVKEVIQPAAEAVKAIQNAQITASYATLEQPLSKLAKNPERRRAYIGAMVKPGMETINFKAEPWNKYWADKGENPTTVIDSMGGMVEADGTITFDSVHFLHGVLSENHSNMPFVVDHARWGDSEMSLAEATPEIKEAVKKLSDFEQKVLDFAKEPTLPSGALDNREEIALLVHQQLTEAKVGDRVAKHAATLAAHSYATMAERINQKTGQKITPKQLMEMTGGLKIASATGKTDRGRYDPITNTILLLPKRDSSTVVHELGHHYLNIMRKMSADEKMAAVFGHEMETLKKWWADNASDVIAKANHKNGMTEESLKSAIEGGVDKLEDGKSVEWAAMHEYFANGFVQYMQEGKAPSSELRNVFKQFATWLLKLIRALPNGTVALDDNIRLLYSRILASDGAIDEALSQRNHLHVTAKDLGLTPEQFNMASAKSEDVIAQMHETMRKKVAKDIAKENQEELKRTQARIRDEVVTEFSSDPVMALMSKGSEADSTAKINIDDAIAQLPESQVEKLKKLGLTSNDGLSLDDMVLASQGRYASVQDVANELESEKSFAAMVNAEVDKRVADEAGLMSDQQIAELAVDIVEEQYGQDLRAAESDIIMAAIQPELDKQAKVDERQEQKDKEQEQRAQSKQQLKDLRDRLVSEAKARLKEKKDVEKVEIKILVSALKQDYDKTVKAGAAYRYDQGERGTASKVDSIGQDLAKASANRDVEGAVDALMELDIQAELMRLEQEGVKEAGKEAVRQTKESAKQALSELKAKLVSEAKEKFKGAKAIQATEIHRLVESVKEDRDAIVNAGAEYRFSQGERGNPATINRLTEKLAEYSARRNLDKAIDTVIEIQTQTALIKLSDKMAKEAAARMGISPIERLLIKISAGLRVDSLPASKLSPGKWRRYADSLGREVNKRIAAKDYKAALDIKREEYAAEEMAIQAERRLADIRAALKEVGKYDTDKVRRGLMGEGTPIVMDSKGNEIPVAPGPDGKVTMAMAEAQANLLPGSTATRKSDALKQIDAIMETLGLSKKAQSRATDRAAMLGMSEYLARLRSTGSMIPALDQVAGKMLGRLGQEPTEWQNVPTEEVLAAAQAIEAIDAASKAETKDSLAVQGLADEGAAQIADLKDRTKANDNALTKFFIYGHSKLYQFLEQLDKGEGKLGWAFQTIKAPIRHAEDFLHKAQDRYLKAVIGAEKLLGRFWDKKVMIAGRSMRRSEALVVAGLYGTEHGRNRLMNQRNTTGDTFTEGQIQEILGSLTDKEWDVVKAYWAANDKNWEDMVAEHIKRGLPIPKKAEPLPFRVGKRTLPGGYMHISYVEDPKAWNPLEEVKAIANGTGIIGETKERAATVSPDKVLDLSREAQIQSASRVIRYNAFGATAARLTKLLNNKTLKASLSQKFTQDWIKSFNDAVMASIAGPPTANNDIERVLRTLRRNGTVAMLGLRLTSAVQQFTGFSNAMANKNLGPGYMLKGMLAAYRTGAWDEIHKLSPYIASRADRMQNDMSEAISSTNPWDVTKPVAKVAMMPITAAQSIVDHAVWSGAFQKAMDSGKTDKEAALIADEIVDQTQGGGAESEVVQFQHSQWGRAITMMMSWQFTQLNQQMSAWRNAKDAPSIMRAMYVTTFAAMIPVFAGLAIKAALQEGDFGPEDEEEWKQWAAKTAIQNYVESYAVLREGSSILFGTGKEQALIAFKPIISGFKAAAGAVKDFQSDARKDDIGPQFFKDMIRAASGFMPLPASQINALITALDEELSPQQALFGKPFSPRQR